MDTQTAIIERRAPADAMTMIKAITPTSGDVSIGRRRLHRKSLGIAVLVGASYTTLVFGPQLIASRIVSALVLVVALTATATSVFHDANHASFSANRTVNRVAGYTGDLLGGSSWIWRFKHNHLHHGNTNVSGIDADIDQAPFARLSPSQQWRPWHRYQHIYMWVLYGFLTLQWLLISDFVELRNAGIGEHPFPRRPRRRDVAALFAGKILHVSWALAIPFIFHRWWIVLSCYLAISWAVGLLLATMFQLAHCTDIADFPHDSEPRRGSDFVWHQLRTTVDVRTRTVTGRKALHWLMGGLDHQIEHHLAPGLPHTVYPLVAEQLSRYCAEHDIEIHHHPTPARAICSHARWLKTMGTKPQT